MSLDFDAAHAAVMRELHWDDDRRFDGSIVDGHNWHAALRAATAAIKDSARVGGDMTTLRIGSPPRRRLSRRDLLITAALGLLGVATTVMATLALAAAIRRAYGYQPIDYNSWLIALIALVGLAAHLAVPSRRRPQKSSRRRVDAALAVSRGPAGGADPAAAVGQRRVGRVSSSPG